MNLSYTLKTKLMFQIGNPLGHSATGKVYNALIKENGLDAYAALIEFHPDELPRFMENLATFRVVGLGVTMPYKGPITDFCDTLDPIAEKFHCTNHVRVDEDGTIHGFSADGIGMANAIADAGVDLQGRKALILGAGNISGPVCQALIDKGVSEVIIANRTVEKADDIAKKLSAPASAIPLIPGALDEAAKACSLVVQCTSLGLYGTGTDFEYLGFLEKMAPGAVAADALYNPDPTSFLKVATDLQLKTVNGMPMLGCQMAEIFKNIFGITVTERSKDITCETMRAHVAANAKK